MKNLFENYAQNDSIAYVFAYLEENLEVLESEVQMQFCESIETFFKCDSQKDYIINKYSEHFNMLLSILLKNVISDDPLVICLLR